MADRTFEMELERRFAESPAFADADLFAFRVETNLERGWAVRRLLIGSLGLIVGLLVTIQVMGRGVAASVSQFASQYAPTVRVSWTDVAFAHLLPGGMQVNGELLWMSAAMALVAVGLGVVQVIREI